MGDRVEKTYIILENTSEMAAEIWMLKTLLGRAQKEMRNVNGNWGKGDSCL